jgi:amino acid adenylation domain-containing protein
MIVAALAIMKAGASYVPIDPEFPAERIAHMLEGARAAVLITQSHHLETRPGFAGRIVALDRDRDAILAQSAEPLGTDVDPAADAYLIFTSGSTGAPKGAAIPHSALVNLLVFMRRTPGLVAGDRLLAIATMSFDLAVLECFLPLSSGAAIVLADRAAATDARRLQAVLRAGGVTVMQGTPSTWRLLLASEWDGSPRVKMLTGGEPLTGGLATELLARGTSLWNLYGPTETTIYSTWRQVREAGADRQAIEPIGRPMPNQPHYILDRSMRPVPVGMTGEIYIGGMCVARGYAHRADLTAERFVPDPFGPAAGARLYRSGDLARYRADGVIEFVGRADFQVKIRGYRVELGEIESAIEKLPGVRECLVLARADAADEPGERRLVAYVRPMDDSALDVPAARAQLRQQLPEYMVPSAFVVLEDFPRLPNGKPDRKRLPAPGAARPPVAVAFEPPAGADEERIARLWQETLKLDRIGANDNFFDVGGHSLLAVGLLGRLREAFGRDLSLVDLFTHPTVRSMAVHLAGTAPAVEAIDTEADAGAAQARVAARRARRQE